MAHLTMSTLQHVQFWMDFFPYLAQMITSLRECMHRSKVSVSLVIQIFALGMEVS